MDRAGRACQSTPPPSLCLSLRGAGCVTPLVPICPAACRHRAACGNGSRNALRDMVAATSTGCCACVTPLVLCDSVIVPCVMLSLSSVILQLGAARQNDAEGPCLGGVCTRTCVWDTRQLGWASGRVSPLQPLRHHYLLLPWHKHNSVTAPSCCCSRGLGCVLWLPLPSTSAALVMHFTALSCLLHQVCLAVAVSSYVTLPADR